MLRILHTNDFHGRLDDGIESRLAALRQDCDCYFDCGDVIKAGNLGIPLRPEEAWNRLSRLACSASVLGNRETHVLTTAFAKKLEGHTHPILCANLALKNGEHPLPGSLKFQVAGIRVGVVAVMVPMVKATFKTQAASSYLWTDPIEAAIREAEPLEEECDCLIALTHIGLSQDLALASRYPGFHFILGGHSHNILQEPKMVGKTAVCQTGSHGRFAGRYDWSMDQGLVRYELVPLS